MPGIAGLISRRPAAECQRLLEQMLLSMQHESFYTWGRHADTDLGVFAGWVALKGSFADGQPLVSERGDIAMLLAGECFSDPATRARLKERGHPVEGNDAAWLVHLYEDRGEAFLADLNGLFSGLLIDRRQAKAFLFNDRYGMERVYYHEGREGFFFASEAKALLAVLPELRAFDDDGLSQFLHYGCTLETRTLFRGIKLLPGASVWRFTAHTCHKSRFFAPQSWEAQPTLPAPRFADELQTTFSRVLPRYFESGRIGVSLTAGLDTRMIMACRPQSHDDLVSYTFAGLFGTTLDARLAGQVATACRVPHSLIRITEEFFADFASLAERTVYITDGTFDICGAHEIFLNNRARELAPVRLTGNFGSEILRGVTTFKPLGLSHHLFNQGSVRQTSQDAGPQPGPTTHPVSFAAFTEVPLHLAGVVRAAQSQINCRTPYMDNEMVALAFRAPESARQSPSAALHVVRRSHPVLSRIRTDNGLVPASPLRSLANYPWYRASFKLDYWCSEGMPHWLSGLEARLRPLGLRPWTPGVHKYLHYGNWFRNKLSRYLHERLTDRSIVNNHLWNRRFLHRLAPDHTAGRKNYVHEINAVLTLGAIERLLLRPPTATS